MKDEIYPLYRLLKEDQRYPIDAYQFIRDALTFAQDQLHMGLETVSDISGASSEQPTLSLEAQSQQPLVQTERHLTGQELCEAIRQYAIEQYGYLAKTVLNSWGIYATDDFGNIVYNLISIGWMKKSPQDRQEHFNNVYDFATVFVHEFKMSHVED